MSAGSSVKSHDQKGASAPDSDRPQHTPGPWFVSPLFTEHGFMTNDGSIVIMAGDKDGDSFPVGHACLIVRAKRGMKHRTEDPARNANVHLMTASPELLEAVEICLKAEEERRQKLLPGAPATTYCEARIAKLRAAIAKAKGKS